MAQFKIVNKDTGKVEATDSGTPLEMVKKYSLAYASGQHLKLVQVSG